MSTSYRAHTLALDGVDALSFAQAQFSSNVLGLEIGQWQFSAWLDARGRIRFFFHLARVADQKLILLLRGGQAEAMAAELRRYVFRARVTIRVEPTHALGRGAPLPLHAAQLAEQSDALMLGCGDYSLKTGSAVEADDAWRLPQIHALWPWLPDNALDQWLPPALGLDQLGATALDKGCYPGQEIVARLHYRGGNKRHLYRVQLSQPIPTGAALMHEERELLRVLDVVESAAGVQALAVIADEFISGESAVVALSAHRDNDSTAVQVTIHKTPDSPLSHADSAE